MFCQFVEKLFKLSEIPTETIYIDGTKIEAYVEKFNKYTNYLVIADTKTLIPFFEKIKSQNIEIKNVVADAGYESFPNYEYLEKIIKYNNEFKRLSKKSKDNIESDLGKQLRIDRSIQVERAFAILKEEMKLRKLKVRGKNSTKREIRLFCIAYNFNKYLAKLSRKKQGAVLHSLKTA